MTPGVGFFFALTFFARFLVGFLVAFLVDDFFAAFFFVVRFLVTAFFFVTFLVDDFLAAAFFFVDRFFDVAAERVEERDLALRFLLERFAGMDQGLPESLVTEHLSAEPHPAIAAARAHIPAVRRLDRLACDQDAEAARALFEPVRLTLGEGRIVDV